MNTLFNAVTIGLLAALFVTYVAAYTLGENSKRYNGKIAVQGVVIMQVASFLIVFGFLRLLGL